MKHNRRSSLTMETRYAERKKHLYYKSDQDDRNGEDRISDLPCEIVHQIFSFLPIQHVARTCVLSKRWKYLWYSYPCLDFSTAFYSSFERDHTISGRDCAIQKQCDRIDEVLSSLDKHWDVRILKFHGFMNVSTIVRSMHVVVQQNIQELDLEFFTRGCFDLPHCIINSLSLRDLRLKAISISSLRLPPLDASKNCFKSLQSLNLCGADFCDQSSLLNLFTDSLFPSLTKLHLEFCSGLEHLRIEMSGLKYLCIEASDIQELDISAEKLEKLTVRDCLVVDAASSRVAIDAPLLEFIFWMNGVTGEFVIRKCDSLKEAIVDLYLVDEDLSDLQLHGFSNFLHGISACRSLTLISFFEVLSRSRNPLTGVERCVFNSLTSLQVILGEDNSDLLDKDIINWESLALSLNLFLHRLKVVKIYGFDKCWNDVGLVKILLNNGKVLEQLIILLDDEDYSPLGEDIKSEIMEFPRASSNVQIIFQ